MKDLIVYYSRTGKTARAAREIAAGRQAIMGVHSTLVDPDFSLKGYDRVVLCQPFWASYAVPAVNTFLAGIDPPGKRFILVAVKGGPPRRSSLRGSRPALNPGAEK